MKSPWLRVAVMLLAAVLLLCALTAALHQATAGNVLGSDLYIYYRAGQAIFNDHTNPYDREIGRQVQLAVYKRLAAPAEDQLNFAYPLFALIFIQPLINLSFDWLQALCLAFNLLALSTALVAGFRRPPRWLPVLILFIYPVSFGLLLGNFNLPVMALLLLALGWLLEQRTLPNAAWVALGVGLAWATCKPQFSALFLILILALALRSKRWLLLAGFFGGLIGLLAWSFALYPAWVGAWLALLSEYTAYNHTWVVLTLFLKELLPLDVAIVLTIVAALAAVVGLGWLTRRWWLGRLSGLGLLVVLAGCAFLLRPRGVSYEQMMFLLPVIAWAALRHPPRAGWWLAGFAFASWGVFALSRLQAAPESTADWLFFLYPLFVWVERKSIFATSSA